MSLGGSDQNVSQQTLNKSQKTIDKANVAVADAGNATLDFTKEYFDTYVAPAIAKLDTATANTQAQNTAIFNQQNAYAADFKATYDQYGKPAIGQYMDTVRDFSTDAYAETQAALGIGDVRNQQAIAQQSTNRALGNRGINAGSGAAVSALNKNNTAYAIAAAAQANRARDLATNQKLNLQADAANKGIQLGQLAPAVTAQQIATVGQGAAIPASNLAAIADAQKAQYPGYSAPLEAQSTILGNASGVAKQAVDSAQKAQSADDEGVGKAIGTAIGVGSYFLSDRRVKQDIKKVGATPDGLNVYSFKYLWEKTTRLGYMADEVEQIYPNAVGEYQGYKTVNYGALPFAPQA